MARDAGLCHGTAGIAHLFNRMYQATGDALLADAARYWYERTLMVRKPGVEIAGYRVRLADGSQPQRAARPGFLTGAAGIGLSLLSAISDVEPSWDRLLLVSVPPRGTSGSSAGS